MPKYYCDYCDTFLTHDSPSVRKTHNGGRKHKENVRMYYQGWMEEQAQKLVDATTRAFTQGRMLNPGSLPGGMPNPGMMGPRGALPPQMMCPPMPGMPFFPPQMAAMMAARGAPPMPGGMPSMPGGMPSMPGGMPPMPGMPMPPGMMPPMSMPMSVGGIAMPHNGPPPGAM